MKYLLYKKAESYNNLPAFFMFNLNMQKYKRNIANLKIKSCKVHTSSLSGNSINIIVNS
jgi:hypothetical protein